MDINEVQSYIHFSYNILLSLDSMKLRPQNIICDHPYENDNI